MHSFVVSLPLSIDDMKAKMKADFLMQYVDGPGMNKGCGERSVTRLEDTGMKDVQFCCFTSLVAQPGMMRSVDENEEEMHY